MARRKVEELTRLQALSDERLTETIKRKQQSIADLEERRRRLRQREVTLAARMRRTTTQEENAKAFRIGLLAFAAGVGERDLREFYALFEGMREGKQAPLLLTESEAIVSELTHANVDDELEALLTETVKD